MTKVLNIDELLNNTKPRLTIIVDGEKHFAKVPTVEDFLGNLKDLEALAASPDAKGDVELTCKMIERAFPTLPVDRVKTFPIEAIEQLFNMVRSMEAEEKAETEKQSAES